MPLFSGIGFHSVFMRAMTAGLHGNASGIADVTAFIRL
jgi:hypothetical protein